MPTEHAAPPAQIQRSEHQRLIHRQGDVPIACPHRAGHQRVRKRLPQRDTNILHRMVIIHLRIARAARGQVKSPMAREKRKHVVQKPAACSNGGFALCHPH